ncbi:hypothetical protein MZE22_16120, partial [Escherichia coli]|uniref:hypothetical protein n=1 Tax=Escherichia coli TaxID=562 RepID=UPI001FFE3455|nr:hypothetical protein [Escherichia coli]MCK2525423.1 hypothetical protein [Escherichia coli]
MDILSEEEVSYYKKSLISQEGSIKKGAPGDAPVVAKSALWGVITPCLRIPLYSITDWHRSPISDSHPFDQPG